MLARGVKQRMLDLDWNFIKGSALLSVGMALARGLGLAFSLVLAGAFSPEDYGNIQYAIALAMIVAVGTQPFGQHVLARFIGRYRNDADHLDRILANYAIMMAALVGLTLLVAVPVLIILGQFNVGILVIFVGSTLFYAYWGLSSGFLAPSRLTTAYLGSNIVQIVLVLVLIFILRIQSPMLALLIYGLSYLLPVALLQHFWPFPIRLELSRLRRDVVGEIMRFSWPIWASHISFTLYYSIELLLLKRYSGPTAVGVYSLARTLALVFTFVPTGIATLLMPEAAASPGRAHRQLLKKMLALCLFANGGLLIVYLASVGWFVQTVFGPGYVVGLSIYVILAFKSILMGFHGVTTAVLVGRGNPGAETISRGLAVVAVALAGLFLVPVYGPLGAAIAALLGVLCALASYGVMALRNGHRSIQPWRKARE